MKHRWIDVASATAKTPLHAHVNAIQQRSWRRATFIALSIGLAVPTMLPDQASAAVVESGTDFPSGGPVTTSGNIIGNGAIGSLTVDAGSNLAFTGLSAGFSAGRNAGGLGAVYVNSGGSITGANEVNVGSQAATGSLTIDGAGSKVGLVGVGTNPAQLGVGNNFSGSPLYSSTSGVVTIQNGGELDVSFNGVAQSSSNIGQRGGTGTVNITGAGSKMVLSGDNAGNADPSVGASMIVGHSSGGTLNITAGGSLTFNDTPGYGGINIGGAGGQVSKGLAAGSGTVLVDGAGSKLDVQSTHGYIQVGRSGTGSLTVQNGGAVNAETVSLGRDARNPGNPVVDPGAVGTLVVSGPGSSLNLAGNDGPNAAIANVGARLVVGVAGTGTATVSGGGALTINPDTPSGAASGGLYVGGGINPAVSGGTGTLNVTTSSSVTIGGAATNSVIMIGGNGTGTLNITGGSTVSLPGTGAMYVGATAPGITTGSAPLSGTVSVAGGSTLSAGSFLGVGSDGTNNATGTASLLLSGNSTVSATNIVVGQHGLFGGNGTVNGNVTNNGGVIQVGASPDSLIIAGHYTQTGGTIKLEVFSDGAGGFRTDSLIFADPTMVALDNVAFDFTFMPGADPVAFQQSGDFNLGTFLMEGDGTTDTPLNPTQIAGLFNATTPSFAASSADPSVTIDHVTFTADGSATAIQVSVPEPGGLGVFVVALAGMLGLRRRRAVS